MYWINFRYCGAGALPVYWISFWYCGAGNCLCTGLASDIVGRGKIACVLDEFPALWMGNWHRLCIGGISVAVGRASGIWCEKGQFSYSKKISGFARLLDNLTPFLNFYGMAFIHLSGALLRRLNTDGFYAE